MKTVKVEGKVTKTYNADKLAKLAIKSHRRRMAELRKACPSMTDEQILEELRKRMLFYHWKMWEVKTE